MALAWRDAVVRPEEIGCLRHLLFRLGYRHEEVQAWLEAGTQAPPDEAFEPLAVALPDHDSRRTAMRMLVALTFADHETAPQELEVLGKLARQFGYGAEELDAARRYAAVLLDPNLRTGFAGPCGRCRTPGPLFDGRCAECWRLAAPEHPEWGDVCGRCGERRPAFESVEERTRQRCRGCLCFCGTCDRFDILRDGLCERCRPAGGPPPPTRRPSPCLGCPAVAVVDGFCADCVRSPKTLETLAPEDVPQFLFAFFGQVRLGQVHLYSSEWRELEATGFTWGGLRCRRCEAPVGDPGSSNHYGGNCWECWGD